ncbi:MAG: hypothetical protein ABSA91_13610 [Acidimicrobiales bacterium]|jgi:hypothetical protein
MTKRAAILAAGIAAVAVALGGCGVSVDAGGENAATHPASGIFVSNTVGGGNISVHTNPTVAYQPPPSTPPASVPAGLTSAVAHIESVVTGGCWQDAHYGNVYGAYDQLFWWQGGCGDTIGQVTVELYATAAAASANAHHSGPSALLDRYRDGAALVDVYTNAPLYVLADLGRVRGLVTVAGYGGV